MLKSLSAGLLGTSAVLLVAFAAAAQETDGQPAVTEIGEIVVTPNRTPTDKAKTGSKVDTIDRETITEQALPQLTDYLSLLPGIAISSTGGIGAEGSLAIRGAARRYVKTLYNGIDISDPSNTQVQTSYQYLLADGIEQIEVLKGSQSTLYGSDAIAGVISLSSLGGIELGTRQLLHAEGGSHGTARGSYGLRSASQDARFALNLIGYRTDGISAASSGTERDGYENVTFDANGEYRINEYLSVFASGLYIDAKAQYDNAFASPPADDLLNTNFTEQFAGRAGFNLDLMEGRLKNTVSVQGFDVTRDIVSTGFLANYNGTRAKIDYQGSFEATEWLLLQYGADHERQNSDTLTSIGTPFQSATSDSFSMTGVWAQFVIEPVDALTLSAGLRHDEHSDYGGHTTYRATASYALADWGTRFHSSIGTGFRAPSLFELNDPFSGNPTLQPETSFSFDAGVEQTFLGGRLVTDLTFFLLDIDNLIINNASTGFVYQQVPGTTEQRGVEASAIWRANDWLDLGAAYTYTDSYTEAGARNIRVPRHTVGLTASARPWEKWVLTGSARIAIDTVDTGNFALDDYVLVNAKVAYKPTEDTEVYLRVENLFDVEYETARGFGQPGISLFGGFRAAF